MLASADLPPALLEVDWTHLCGLVRGVLCKVWQIFRTRCGDLDGLGALSLCAQQSSSVLVYDHGLASGTGNGVCDVFS